jgi:hypothetical protein
MLTALLERDGIDERFGLTRALKGARPAVRPGGVHAVPGRNGAGEPAPLPNGSVDEVALDCDALDGGMLGDA